MVYTFDQAIGLSGSGPGGLPPNPDPGGGTKLDVRAVSGIARVNIGAWQPVLSVQSAGIPPEWVPLEEQALISGPQGVDGVRRIACVRLDSEGRVAEVGGAAQNGARWWLSLADAIAAVNLGYTFFVERPEGDRVAVELAVSRSGRKYLRTEADGDAPNNLLALPRC